MVADFATEEGKIMGKYQHEAQELLKAIGGKENVTAVTHCATRMRLF